MFLRNAICNKASAISKAPWLCHLVSRDAHTDIKVPDYSKYMRDSVASPHAIASDSDESRKLFTYVISGMMMTTGLYAAKAEIVRDVLFMDVSKDVMAMARIEINLNEIVEDKNVTIKWRGKPLFIWNRPPKAVEEVRQVPLSILKDPERDEDRVKDSRFLICVGICTHLGCAPFSHQGDYGGYYCPCHGSHFDISGRTRKGPAPTNMEIPPYTITPDNIAIVG